MSKSEIKEFLTTVPEHKLKDLEQMWDERAKNASSMLAHVRKELKNRRKKTNKVEK